MNFRNESWRRVLLALAGSVGLIALMGAHLFVANQPGPVAAYLAVLDHLFDLGFAAFVMFIGLALGRIVLRRVGFRIASGVERDVFALVIGLGAIVELLIGLGFLRLLYAPLLIAILLLLTGFVSNEMRVAFGEWKTMWRACAPFSKI
ncbi:MAG: hypothetical protein AB1817_11725, partial [Chloroflexota bacterium]